MAVVLVSDAVVTSLGVMMSVAVLISVEFVAVALTTGLIEVVVVVVLVIAVMTVAVVTVEILVAVVTVEMVVALVETVSGRKAAVVLTTVAATFVAAVTVAEITADVVPPHAVWPLLGVALPSLPPLVPFLLACVVFHVPSNLFCAGTLCHNFHTHKAFHQHVSFHGSLKLSAD